MTAVVEVVTAPTGTPVPNLEPGSADWLRTMSASKVAAALGLSPYESPFSLWHRMADLIPAQDDAPHLARGHYLEDGICRWFVDQHPGWTIQPGGSWARHDNELYTASPDRLTITDSSELRGLEVKTAADDNEWGEPGTDQIPVGYRAQCMWQMDVVGTRVTHVAVLSAYLELREYVVHYDVDEAEFIRRTCQEFLDTLPGGLAERRPGIDERIETYNALRKLHPDIDPIDVELDPETARQYCHARHALAKAEAAAQHATSLLADELGNAKTAKFLGNTIARRQSKNGGVPYVVAGRNLPTFDEQEPTS